MANLQEILRRQQDIGAEIQRIITNYKKDPSSRKTSTAYYQLRLDKLKSLLSAFDDEDSTLRAHCADPMEHRYFSEDYYGQIADLAKKYMKEFEDNLNVLEVSEAKDATQDTQQLRQPSLQPERQEAPRKKEEIQKPQISLRQEQQTATENICGLIRKQNALKQSLHRQLQTDDGCTQLQYWEVKRQCVSRLWEQIEQLHHQIFEAFQDPIDLGYELENYVELESNTQNKLVQITARLAKQQPNVSYNETNLPQISIPKFDGNYLRWQQFMGLFNEVIDKKPLSSVQKFWYLKGSLTGEAERIISHLSMTESNYQTAWSILKDRFDNDRIIVESIIRKLVEQPHIDSPSASTIKQLHDVTKESLLSLKNIQIDTTSWDPLLIHILLKKLDKQTLMLFEQSLVNPRLVPSMKSLLDFLESRFRYYEAMSSNNVSKQGNSSRANSLVATKPKESRNVAALTCKCCSLGSHPMFTCRRFLQMPILERLKFVRSNKLCLNCLKVGHMAGQCVSRSCVKCNKRHNTLLHTEDEIKEKPKADVAVKSEKDSTTMTIAATRTNSLRPYVLLSTAIVTLASNTGQTVDCRALLDSGSQVNLVSSRLIKRLGITPKSVSLYIQGIGSSGKRSQHRVNVGLHSKINGFTTRLEAFVLSEIISPQPSQHFNIVNWPIPENIKLADPNFNCPDKIDVLLGAEIYHQLLSIGQIQLGESLPTLQNTTLGWVLSGKIASEQLQSATCGMCTDDDFLMDSAIERLWKLDEVESTNQNFSPSEQRCESHFAQNTTRCNDGRFMVRLPFADNPKALGESKKVALNRFLALERRLSKDEETKQQYIAFMKEYKALGHMTKIDIESVLSPSYFIPHHCVRQPGSITTKLRVVFDASAKTASGYSLNDLQYTGPVVQSDLFSILLRFRIPRFVFTTDIEKMYRQILVHPDERRYQIIIWREQDTSPIEYYELNTVTYGTRSAPYIAIKCLQTLAKENIVKYPLGSQALTNNFYVDDCLSGSDSLVAAMETQKQLKQILKSAGFILHKWCANHPQLLQGVSENNQEVDLDLLHSNDQSVKTLGLTWLPKADNLCIKVNVNLSQRITKRSVSSDLARLFDPLGILAPIVVTAKIFIQELWQLKLSWDQALPAAYHTKWTKFMSELPQINNLKVSRHVFSGSKPKSIQLHAFSDASEKAFGAAIYIRSCLEDGRVLMRLLCAKSRVAPLKHQTLPRLELCAAVLSAQLATRVRTDLMIQDSPTFFWTDSSIVLSWINTSSSTFQTFVANRVSTIQELTLPEQWRHITSKNNPADVLTRNLSPNKLIECNLWFYGPIFLHGKESGWPSKILPIIHDDSEKRRNFPSALATTDNTSLIYTINHSNSFGKLQRIIGYMRRFISHARGSPRASDISLTPKEIDDALITIVGVIQRADFRDDIKQLRKHKVVSKSSSLIHLSPFLDDQNILRVGGRLKASQLPFDAKHQMLLPYNDPLVKLLFEKIHKESKHCGPQALLAQSRQRFWAINGKTMARATVQRCIRCTRARPQLSQQVMGNLPITRVTPSRPFVNTGLDYCGPFWVHYKIRGKRPHKAYIAVFCCFTTKAVHFELVTDLTTEAFLGALRRFISRRGHCQNLYCDNATNFVGAQNKLAELASTIHSTDGHENITNECSNKGIKFNFIPPRTPHFGGLWEAAVKSAKHLLLRSVTTASLTYEELETVVIEVEGILNSRPLTPMSESPDDLTALTPGHFLIGQPITSQIDVNAVSPKTNLLTRWKLVSHLKQEFWKRWSREYLNELQYRRKWKEQCQNIEPGDMVIVKEDNVPVMQWPLGRVTRIYHGDDGAVRVVDVKMASGEWKRPIHRLAPLPITEDNLVDEEEDSNEVPRKRKKTTYSNVITGILILMLLLPAVIASGIKNLQFNSNIGVHFEGIGRTKISRTEWKLLVYYDLTSYWTDLQLLSNGISTLDNLCQDIQEKSTCVNILSNLEHTVSGLKLDDSLLKVRRAKRGAVNIIGNIANSLFGVLDSEYAQQMSKTILQIRENEEVLTQFIKNQTSIIDSTINIFKQDQAAVKRKFDELDVQFREVQTAIRENRIEQNQIKTIQMFTSIAMQLMMTATSLQQIQSSILDIIADSHHGKISPMILSHAQLQNELFRIRNQLPGSLQLPVDQTNFLQLYKLMTVKGGFSKDHVVFDIDLPLCELNQFDLYRMFPIPNAVHGDMLSIKACNDILAINPHKDHYFPMSMKQLETCVLLNKDEYLCGNIYLTHNIGAEVCHCEVQLFNNETPLRCNVVHVTSNSTWTPINTRNQWMYSLRNPIRVTTICEEEMQQIILKGSGILTVEPQCTIKQKSIVIQGHQKYSSIIHTSYTRLSNLTDMTSEDIHLNFQKMNETYHDQIRNLSDLQKSSIFHSNPDLHNQIQKLQYHQSSISYIGLVLVIIFSVRVAWVQYFKRHLKTEQHTTPQPAPRQPNSSTDFVVTVS